MWAGAGRLEESSVKDDMKLLGLQQPEWVTFRDMWRDFIHGTNI